MKRQLVATLAAVAAAVFAAPAAAQFYLGAGAGAAKTGSMNASSATTTGVPFNVSGAEENRFSSKILGGYQFTPNWGMEAQAAQLGNRSATVAFGAPVNARGTTNRASVKHSGIAGTGTLPLGQNFYLMGKLGVSFNSMDTMNVAAGGANATSSNSRKTDALVGVGGGYNFNDHLGFRLEIESFGKMSKAAETWNTTVKGQNLSLNLLYRF